MSPKRRQRLPNRVVAATKKHAKSGPLLSAAHQYVYDSLIQSLKTNDSQVPWHQKDPFVSPNGNEPISLLRAQKAVTEWKRNLSESDRVLAEFDEWNSALARATHKY